MTVDVERQAFASRLNELLDDKQAPPKGDGLVVATEHAWSVLVGAIGTTARHILEIGKSI